MTFAVVGACDGQPESTAWVAASITRVDLAESLGENDSLEVWAHERRVSPDGSVEEETREPRDRALLASLEAITQEDFLDPEVQVIAEDYSFGEEDGTSVTGVRVRLQRRVAEDEEELRRHVEDATGQSWDEWVEAAASRPTPVARTKSEEADLLRAELDAADEADVSLFVRIAGEPAIQVPRFPSSPVPLSALELADLRVARLEAMAARGEEIMALQDGFVAWLEANGGAVTIHHWLDNALVARVPSDLIGEIASRPDVTWVQRSSSAVPNAPGIDHTAIRADAGGIQAQHFWSSAIYGQTASSRNDYGIYVGIVEAARGLSTNHQGFDDGQNGSSRVASDWDCEPFPCDGVLPACDQDPHGMIVASALLSDYTLGQHPLVTGTERSKRTGVARKAHASLIQFTADEDVVHAIEKAMAENVDIVNYSAGTCLVGTTCCDPNPVTRPEVDAVNDAYYDGILWIGTVGNNEQCGAPTCEANNEAAAFGSIAVAGFDAAAENGSLDDNVMCSNSSSDGRASWGPVADLAGPAAVYAPMNCADGFQATTQSCEGTSWAAPFVSGGGALLMEHWIETFSDAHAHQPGRMHSVMLMLADGCGSNDGIDGRWGAGRFRMRRFDDNGLDAPYKAISASFTATPADPGEMWYLNSDVNGNLISLPADVDAFIATAFCRVTNPATFTGQILLRLENHLGQLVTSELGFAEKTKLTWNPGALQYVLEAEMLNMPAGSSAPCYVTWAWEDSDRDDPNGLPNVNVDPWYVGTDDPAPSCDGC